MSKRLIFISLLLFASLFLGACDQINSISQSADVSQIENAAFYGALQATVAKVQIPVIIVGLLSLVVGWKMGRFGLALNGFVIGGLLLYTFLGDSGWVTDESFKLGLSVVGAIISALLSYFLYNLMALIMGGAIGMMLMNGAWFQASDTLPPQILGFITTFVSALIMFLVFRVFLVAFSAVIGAALLMLAVPFQTLWVIPVAAVGTVVQIIIALAIKDDIFQNLRGDFGAAFSKAFGDILGPFGTMLDYQKSKSEDSKNAPKAAPRPVEKAKPEPVQKPYQPPAQSYQAPQQKPYQAPQQPSQQPYQAPPANRPAQQPSPAPQQPYQAPQQPAANPAPQQKPYQPPQQPYQAPQQPAANPYQAPQPSQQPAPIPPVQPQPVFHAEQYQIVLSTGQVFPLVGTQLTVGRNPDNTIVINDAQVSGYHLMLSIQAEGLVAWDNNTTNGTMLNGVMLTGAVRLSTADVLQVGAVSLRLVRVAF
jgi:pSer/pThr/pTyr-binding forkhead associated (FHA) protein